MKKTIRDFDIKNKKVLIRVDFNVPIKDGKIVDDNRIRQSLKTIKFAIEKNAKVILLSHLGRIKTEEDLKNAVEYAHLQDVIAELPEGIETRLGERGLTLSGGQRQRVAIARAMIRKAPIVILDEATSALDNESEALVQKAIDNLMNNRTVFIIAHRLSTIKNADRIAVINEGELVELGTHDELMAIENGAYKALYEMQFRAQEETVQ